MNRLQLPCLVISYATATHQFVQNIDNEVGRDQSLPETVRAELLGVVHSTGDGTLQQQQAPALRGAGDVLIACARASEYPLLFEQNKEALGAAQMMHTCPVPHFDTGQLMALMSMCMSYHMY